MIPPIDGSPMADPPPWYDQVIDLTLDEALGLFEMGVRVYLDFAAPSSSRVSGWYDRPYEMTVRSASEIKASEFYTRLCYIRREDA